MKCTSCQEEIDLRSAVEHSTRSWPALQTILHICPKCSARLYLRFEKNTALLLCPESILRPTWRYTASEPCNPLAVHAAPIGLRIRIGPLKRIVPGR